MNDDDPVVAVWSVPACGCRAEIRRSDLPIHSIMCEHGNYVTVTGDEVNGNVIMAKGQ